MELIYPRVLDGQFLIGDALAEIQARLLEQGAKSKCVGDLPFLTFDPMQLVVVKDSSNTVIGALLGTPVDSETGVVSGEYRLSVPLNDDIDEFVEKQIYSLSGSFVFVLLADQARRIYLDACGSLSLVYDPERRTVASTSSLLLKGNELSDRFDRELYDFLRVERDGWFPGGLTGHIGIKRLMPNFYLDLEDFSTHRHWPIEPVGETSDPSDTCQTLLNEIGNTVRHLTEHGTVSVALTAGNETRMILAASKDFANKLNFVTVNADTHAASIDVIHASDIAKRFDLKHELIPLVKADNAAADEWRSRNGYCFGGPHIYNHPTIAALKARDYFVGGLGGEIGRAFFWRPDDTRETKLDAGTITARLGMPISKAVTEAVSIWLDQTQGFDSLTTLDLAYLELRMGCWGFAVSYGDYTPIDIHPLISRRSFVAMLSMPPEWRVMKNLTNPMILETVRLGWPELLETPLNKFGDHRDRFSRVRRAIKQPHLVLKRLRKRFG
ncbi:hypothetical protein IWQ52_005052 [Labrenzia sp. EL_159]|nr:hypothetical protein [Labrenzia sp. EL_162]MBG6197505.1 hypothetical protein [Labrenzia sp. EL_159]